MKICFTSDTHHTVDIDKWIPECDVFVHCGDLCQTGYPDDWKLQLEWLKNIPAPIRLFCPGNHDFHLQIYPGPALQDLRSVGVTCIGLPRNDNFAAHLLPNGMTLLGLPGVTKLPRWAFNRTEDELEKYLKLIKYHPIIVSHAPPYGFLDQVNGESVGIRAYAEHAFVHKPKHWIFGHIHENGGKSITHSITKTQFHNVAMCDRIQQHTNPPLILDL